MDSLRIILILLIICSTAPEINAQFTRFPNCDDMEIANMKWGENAGELEIRIFNNCDTCEQHVYTGLIAYSKEEIIAEDRILYGARSPGNKTTSSYILLGKRKFDIKEITRIEMIGGLCDSLVIKK